MVMCSTDFSFRANSLLKYFVFRHIVDGEKRLILSLNVLQLMRVKMVNQIEVESCCELGVKGSCVTCEYSCFCNGKWNHTTNESTRREVV